MDRSLPGIVAAGLALLATLPTPLSAQAVLLEDQLVASSDGMNDDHMGVAAAVDGNVAVFGAPDADPAGPESGAAYVYRFNGAAWVEEQKLVASDGAANGDFGTSVAVSGSAILVGAPRGSPDGAAYVFRFNGTTWVEEQKLTPANPTLSGERFGDDVALDGDLAAIGAPFRRGNLTSFQGAVYMFRRVGGAWGEEALLQAADGWNNDYLGTAVDVDGDAVVAGAPNEDAGGIFNAGSAYVFRKGALGWVEEDKISASDAASTDLFGASVQIDGNWIVVGASSDDHSGLSSPGSAYCFQAGAGGWIEQQKLLAFTPSNGAGFGRVGTLQGHLLVLGSESENANTGAAYAYRRSGSTWVPLVELTGSDVSFSSSFASAIGISGRTVVAGASNMDRAAGQGYFFTLDELVLDGSNPAPFPGDPLTFSVWGGRPGGLSLLAVVGVNGAPLFYKVTLGSFDGVGSWTLAGATPPGLTGATLDFLAFGVVDPGKVKASAVESVAFQ